MLLFLFLYSLNRIKQKKEHLFLSNCQTQAVILHLQEHTEAKKGLNQEENKEAEDKINKVQAELDS
jgi:hypothetical protein